MTIPQSTIGAEAEVIMGQSPPGESYNRERKGVPLLNGPSEFGPTHPVEVQWTTSPTRYCQPGDVLFCVRGATAGRLNTADKRYCIGRGLAAIRAKPDKFDGGFLRYVLARGYRRFQSRGVGSTFINISADELARFPVPALPLAEQRRIAEILDKADALRAKRRAALAQLDALTRSIFLDMFGDDGTILTRWPTRKLGDLLDFLTSGSRGWAMHYAPSGDLFLRIQNVRRDELLLEDIAFVRAPDTAEAKRTLVRAGDVLLSITADLGRTAVVPDGLGRAFINQHLAILRTKALKPRFLSAYLTSPAGQRQVLGRNKHAVKAGLNFEDIRSFVVPTPPTHLQDEFVRGVTGAERLRSAQCLSRATLDALFASLQHRAFRGEL